MIDTLSEQDLKESQLLLTELLNEVAAEEGTLSGGLKFDVGAQAIQALRETRVGFGNPLDNLIMLTPELFESVGVQLTPIRSHQMKHQFDFYYSALTVSLQPKPGAQFSRVECLLEFGPRGVNEPIIQAIFPTSQWKEVLHWGGSMSLGLNSDLSWEAGLDSTEDLADFPIPAQIQASITNKNNLNSFVVMPDYSFQLGRSEIVATGEGGSHCFWRIDKPELRQSQTVQFGIVFKVLKGTRKIELSGLVTADPSIAWLTANLRDVFDALSEGLKALLRLPDSARKGKDRLPIGYSEKWSLPLPE